ncbi:MAG: hypothetical protein OXU23_02350 [Candidatus Poribacteria bacterium]|nr:hypothetical protein [Candidatus Poribacteria bacterium]MDE0467710.1 hypothetical protein [Candidatus Poribacteria bacterium]
MSRMKTDYILSNVGTRRADSETAREAIDAVQEVVRVSGRKSTPEVEKAKEAFIKAIDDAVKRFSRSK